MLLELLCRCIMRITHVSARLVGPATETASVVLRRYVRRHHRACSLQLRGKVSILAIIGRRSLDPVALNGGNTAGDRSVELRDPRWCITALVDTWRAR
jgi:hypothetical protein